MYSIVLANGKTVQIKADNVVWNEKTRIIRLEYEMRIVARINMDNVVGYIETHYKADK